MSGAERWKVALSPYVAPSCAPLPELVAKYHHADEALRTYVLSWALETLAAAGLDCDLTIRLRREQNRPVSKVTVEISRR